MRAVPAERYVQQLWKALDLTVEYRSEGKLRGLTLDGLNRQI